MSLSNLPELPVGNEQVDSIYQYRSLLEVAFGLLTPHARVSILRDFPAIRTIPAPIGMPGAAILVVGIQAVRPDGAKGRLWQMNTDQPSGIGL